MPKKKQAKPTAGPDLYHELGVDRKATIDDIKRAYRRLALQCHPDKCPGDQAAHERFQRISVAYSVLSDDKKRRFYDQTGTTDGLDISPDEFMDMFQSLLLEIIGGSDMVRDMLACFTPRELSRLPPFPFPKELFPPGTFPPGLRFSSKGLKGMPPQVEELIQGGDLTAMFAAMSMSMSDGPDMDSPGGGWSGGGGGGRSRGKGGAGRSGLGLAELGILRPGAAAAAARGQPGGPTRRKQFPGGAGVPGAGVGGGGGDSDGDNSDYGSSGGSSDWTDVSEGELEAWWGEQQGLAQMGLQQQETQQPPGKPPAARPTATPPRQPVPAFNGADAAPQPRPSPQPQAPGQPGVSGLTGNSESATSPPAQPPPAGPSASSSSSPPPPLVREWLTAARGCDVGLLAALLASDPRLLGCRGTGMGHTALHWCAAKGSVEGVNWLLQQGMDVNVRNDDGATPLHAAARNGRLEAVEALLAWRPSGSASAARAAGGPPSSSSSACGNPASASASSSAPPPSPAPPRCDLSALDGEGRSALQLAAQFGHAQVAELLRRAEQAGQPEQHESEVKAGAGTVAAAHGGRASAPAVQPTTGVSSVAGVVPAAAAAAAPGSATAGLVEAAAPAAVPTATEACTVVSRRDSLGAADARPMDVPLGCCIAAEDGQARATANDLCSGPCSTTARQGPNEGAMSKDQSPLSSAGPAAAWGAEQGRSGVQEGTAGTTAGAAAASVAVTPGEAASGYTGSATGQATNNEDAGGSGSAAVAGPCPKTNNPGASDSRLVPGPTAPLTKTLSSPDTQEPGVPTPNSACKQKQQPQQAQGSPAGAAPRRAGLTAEERAARRAALLAADAAAEVEAERQEAAKAAAAEAAALAAGVRSREEGRAWLEAARCGDLPALQRMLAANPRLLGYQGQGTNFAFTSHTALHWAAAKGHTAAARWLLQLGADPDVPNAAGATPLHAAAAQGAFEAARLLVLEAGARMGETDSLGETARDILLRRDASASGGGGGGGGTALAAELELLARVAALRDAPGGTAGWAPRAMRSALAAAGVSTTGLVEKQELVEATRQLIGRYPPRITRSAQVAAPAAAAAARQEPPQRTPPPAQAPAPNAAAAPSMTSPRTAAIPPPTRAAAPSGPSATTPLSHAADSQGSDSGDEQSPEACAGQDEGPTAAGTAAAAAAVESAKQRGNEAFARRDFSKAVSHYTMALRLCTAPNAVLYSNRSAAYCGMSYYGKAQADAEAAIRLEPQQPKYRCRLGAALLGQLQWREAEAAFRAALQLDPEYAAAAQGLADVRAAAAGRGGQHV